jgi:hypothetical protein
MKFLIDEDVLFSTSPQELNVIKNNLRKIFLEIHEIKKWKWEFSKETIQVCIRDGKSYQDNSEHSKPTLWIALIWANRKGSTRSPEEDREIFISKSTMSKPYSEQNVYTYHSYSDLLQKYNSGNLNLIIR